jgi:hydroxyacylglutathione hydrolase
MILKRFYDEKLAQASYLVGCGATGEALVIDPNRDADAYLDEAARAGLRVTHITETHIHADFVSGARELAARSGGRLHLSDEGDASWKYAYAADDGAVLLHDGDTFRVGELRVEVMHTPGHTPEHLSFVVTDTPAATQPVGVFTGDFVFVGDVGRPDLLERAASMAGTMEAGARTLFHSLGRFRGALPDFAQLWPGHGAGSACGKALGAMPQSTVGYEKLFNAGLAETDEARFVETVLAGQPEPPTYFARMKRINRDGPPVLGGFAPVPRLPGERLAEVMDSGATVVDTRPAAEYAAEHVPGTLNIPLNRAFSGWAGWLLPADRDIHLIAAAGDAAAEAARDLAMIGFDRVAGYFTEAAEAWKAAGRAPGTTEQVTLDDLESRLASGAVRVLDVRGAAEWEAGHIPGAIHIPVGYLPGRIAEIPRDLPLVVQCQGGARSAIAASVLQARGVDGVLNYGGGFAEWSGAGKPVARE